MFIQMLKNQRVTFVNDANQAEAHSPFFMWYNPKSDCYVVSKNYPNSVCAEGVAAGMDKEEAEACVMFKANEYIYRNLQNGK